jgi:Mg2+ and Co2+ transporter CorA
MFRDVTDHIRTLQEKIDSSREVLAFAFEASLLVGQSQETAIAKRLASWAAILAVPTAIAGIYGMNFKPPRCLVWVATASRGADLVFLGSAESRFSAPA